MKNCRISSADKSTEIVFNGDILTQILMKDKKLHEKKSQTINEVTVKTTF